jgi:hypothetical protein
MRHAWRNKGTKPVTALSPEWRSAVTLDRLRPQTRKQAV